MRLRMTDALNGTNYFFFLDTTIFLSERVFTYSFLLTLKITDGKENRENKGRDMYGKRGKMYVYACVCACER